jgi:hypothetical protein
MSEELREDKLTEIVIDFNEVREQGINESWLRMFGSWTKSILRTMFGDLELPVKVVGTKSEVESFARALGGEKNYISAISRYGLDDRRTYQSKAKLDSAIRGFEGTTGIKWPFR